MYLQEEDMTVAELREKLQALPSDVQGLTVCVGDWTEHFNLPNERAAECLAFMRTYYDPINGGPVIGDIVRIG